MKLLLDTDIGSDIDDAICLAYLFGAARVRVAGHHHLQWRAGAARGLASAICKAADREVPIFPGAPRPLLVPPRQPRAQQATAPLAGQM